MQPEQIEKDLMGRDDPHELRPSQLITAIQRITKQRYQLAADNQRLREALSAIARTPADALEAYRRKVLYEVETKLREKAGELEDDAYYCAAALVSRMAREE